jgi:hypothetical protein
VSAERVEQFPPPARVPDDVPAGTDREPPQHDSRFHGATGFVVRCSIGGSHWDLSHSECRLSVGWGRSKGRKIQVARPAKMMATKPNMRA